MIVKGYFRSQISTRQGDSLVDRIIRMDAITHNPYGCWSDTAKIISFNSGNDTIRIQVEVDYSKFSDVNYVILCDNANRVGVVDNIAVESYTNYDAKTFILPEKEEMKVFAGQVKSFKKKSSLNGNYDMIICCKDRKSGRTLSNANVKGKIINQDHENVVFEIPSTACNQIRKKSHDLLISVVDDRANNIATITNVCKLESHNILSEKKQNSDSPKTDFSLSNYDEKNYNLAVALGLKPALASVEGHTTNTTSIKLDVFLRHDKTSDHWAGIDCDRFKNIASVLSNIIRTHKIPEELQNAAFLSFINEVLSENDATYETLQGLTNPNFAKWLCRIAFSEYDAIHRGHFTFNVNIINQFPVVAENGRIGFVSRIFQEEFSKKLSYPQSDADRKIILDAVKRFHDRWNNAWEKDAGLLTKDFKSLSLPIYDSVFGLTDIDETKGDDLFRYVVLEPRIGSDTIIRAVAKDNLTIRKVSIHLGQKEVLKWNGEWHLRSREEFSFSNPLCCWDVDSFVSALKGANCSIHIEVMSNLHKKEKVYEIPGKKQEVFSLSLRPETKSVAFGYTDVFVDMGSTYSKLLRIRTNKDGILMFQSIDQNCKQHSETISFLNQYGLTDLVASSMSIPNAETLCKADIVKFKSKMASSPELYSNFLSEAIKRIARICIKENIIINSIHWSFPRTANCATDFFDNVQQQVRQNIAGYARASTHDAFRLYPEHEALRYMFDAPISRIAQHAKNSKCRLLDTIERIRIDRNKRLEEIDAEAAKYVEDNTKRGFWAAITLHNRRMKNRANRDAAAEKAEISDAAKKEIKTAEDDYNNQEWIGTGILLLHLLQDNLSDKLAYGYVDAGGYSLDSVVRGVSGDIHVLTQSFEAGGEQLWRAVAEKMLHIKHPTSEQRAIIIKSLKEGTYDNAKEFSEILEDIYGEYVKLFKQTFLCGVKSSDKQKSNVKQELGYMVFSGGVANNSAFQSLFDPELTNETLQIKNNDSSIPIQLRTDKVKSPKISSAFLCRLISQINVEVIDEKLEIFRRIVTHHDTGKPCEIYDIVGGMFFDAISRN